MTARMETRLGRLEELLRPRPQPGVAIMTGDDAARWDALTEPEQDQLVSDRLGRPRSYADVVMILHCVEAADL